MNSIAIKYAYEKGYRVSEDGNLLISPTGKILSPRINSVGYYETNIRINGKLHHLAVHRLCAYQKYGEKLFAADCVRHIDGNPLNNSFSNIEIGTYSDNMMDIPKDVRKARAKRATSCKENYRCEELASEIKNYYKTTRSYKKTMELFHITSKGTLFYILKNR